ncbi:SpaH/EbpB family LPXTG-anchored major pilin [Corynebacterium sp. 3HC-13]|uniref:SpaH/EbpB family LPXTG-anchored major pilin n=1 Tax=Corynebacterium poyangense TaxID=2684405 RepID=UPI001CCF3B1A|nr:SpaH/EbpB family LPXTG-anchored major pilin [Corynebacterium poyangense]MBZ8177584.1 SpaH/EbpB family LPXTG-anchored major pilin [Corynebacterium poyangense]
MFNNGKVASLKAITMALISLLTCCILQLQSAHAISGDPDYDPANIDPNSSRSLTIHKFLRDAPASSSNSGGEPVANPGDLGKPLQNVKFQIKQVDADLLTNDGFAKARELAKTRPSQNSTIPYKGFDKQVTTGADGTVKVSDADGIPVGLFVVSELASPDAATTDGKKVTINPAEPFFVFIPMTNSAGNGWNYDIHVYPKNSSSSIEKTVSDAAKNVGDKITYDINSDIPVVEKNGTLNKYAVYDNLDARLIDPVVEVSILNGQKFSEGTDYTLTKNNNKLIVEFNQTGLKKLAEIKTNDNKAKVLVKITATIGSVGETDGIIRNQASLIPNNGVVEGQIPSNEVESKFGKVKVNKTFDGEKKGDLKASFEVYRCSEDRQLYDGPLVINGVSRFDTVDGAVTIDGLQYNDFVNGVPVELNWSSYYCLVEKQTAKGYELLPEPHRFQITEATLKNSTYEVTLDNKKESGTTLPLTGGKGVGLLLGLGILLLGVGTFLTLRNSRNRNER